MLTPKSTRPVEILQNTILSFAQMPPVEYSVAGRSPFKSFFVYREGFRMSWIYNENTTAISSKFSEAIFRFVFVAFKTINTEWKSLLS